MDQGTSCRSGSACPPSRILFSEHHLSHAASAFFCSPFDEAAILTVDGVGEWTTATIGVGRGTELTLLEEIRFPHSLGLLYSAFTAFLGFEVNEGEYKVMGMAPFGAPRYVDQVWKLIRAADDGSFELDMTTSSSTTRRTHVQRPVRRALRRAARPVGAVLHGRQRVPVVLRPARSGPRGAGARGTSTTPTSRPASRRSSRRSSSGWRATRTAGPACRASAWPAASRSTAWPTAASCARGPFEELYVQPAAGDSGGALGAALWGYHAVLGQPRGFVMEHAAWGQEYGRAEIETALDAAGAAYTSFDDEDRLLDHVVERLEQGKVVGWFQGRFEWGPRALGHRSILADPRRPEMKDLVNTKIKFREPFRPFAPSVPVGRAEEYFALSDAARHYPARFMLYVVDVHDAKRDAIPAVTHVDGTARLQTVREDTAPRYHRLIERFGKATGVPVLLNTSFNLKGEPIVNTPAEALATFGRSGMDVLVLGDTVVEKRTSGGSEP